MNNSKVIEIKRGQLLTGRKSLSVNTRISQSKIFRLLKCYESEHLIEQQKNNRYSIITIVNYTQYQPNEQLIEQPVNSQRTASEQPVNTPKKDKKDKKDKNITPTLKSKHLDVVFLSQDEFLKLEKQFGADGARERIEELNLGIMTHGYKYKSCYHAILTWDRRKKKEQTPSPKRAPGLTPDEVMAQYGHNVQ